MLAHAGHSIEGKRAVVSGSGNVALYAIEKLGELGAVPVTASDSGGFIHDPDGITGDRLEWLKDLKENRRGRISEYAEEFGCDFHAGRDAWSVPCDLAFPAPPRTSSTIDDARQLIDNGLVGSGRRAPTCRPRSTPSTRFRTAERPVRPRQGRQRRRRRRLRARAEPELAADLLVARRGRRTAPDDHGGHPRPVRRPRHATATASTTSREPTSPASSRSPTPCSPTDTCRRADPPRHSSSRVHLENGADINRGQHRHDRPLGGERRMLSHPGHETRTYDTDTGDDHNAPQRRSSPTPPPDRLRLR